MEDAEGWFLGANAELSRAGYKFSESPWTTELRPIVGYKGKDWLFARDSIGNSCCTASTAASCAC
jgi:hypothetical protein